MLLKLSEQLTLDASQEDVWKLLRDTERLAALLPGVEAVKPLGEGGPEAYEAQASDKVGPFKVALHMEIRIAEEQPPSMLKASLKGADSMGLNRLTGSLRVNLSASGQATLMHFEADIEICRL